MVFSLGVYSFALHTLICDLFELTFVRGVVCVETRYFACGCAVVAAPSVGKTLFAQLCCLFSFVKNQLTVLCGTISGLFILFY